MREQEEDTRERDDRDVISIPLSALLQWIPVWLALIGMFLSAANVYANIMTRLGTLETRVNLFSEVINRLESEVNTNERKETERNRRLKDEDER